MPKTNAQIRIDLEAENTRLKAQRNELRAVLAQALGDLDMLLSNAVQIAHSLQMGRELTRARAQIDLMVAMRGRLANPHETEETRE